MKRLILGVIASLAMGTATAEAPEALVSAASGSVQVAGAALAEGSSVGAYAGDNVTVADGRAIVTYGDGCVVNVVDSYQVAEISPCKAGLQPGSTAKVSDGAMVWLGVGGIAVLGLAAGSGGDDDKPSSP